MQRSKRTPDDYLAALPEPQAADMRRLDDAISTVMAGHERYLIEGKFWGGSDQEIIAYGTHVYTNRSGKTVEWHIAGLALQKNYMSVYLNAVEDNRYLVETYASRLGKVKTGKSAITFKRLEDVELDVLLAMIAHARDIMAATEAGA
ncbi:MAG: DUF1801 domain-containing protein [Thermomicrobiales bacterium]|nr:DUF1801 domain-containing protein [Thermomicrobiales bacterium]